MSPCKLLNVNDLQNKRHVSRHVVSLNVKEFYKCKKGSVNNCESL